MAPAPAPPPPRFAIGGAANLATDAANATSTMSSQAIAPAASRDAALAPVQPSMVIRTGVATLEVDSLDRAIASVQTLAASVGGVVGNSSVSVGDDRVRRASLELRIPAARYDAVAGGLTPLGTVESIVSNAEDVGEEFADLAARVTNARRLESRLIALLAERTGKLQDALAVERELARVREEIERYEGRSRYLATRAAISTLTISLHEPLPLVGSNPNESPLTDAVRQAWRNFIGMIAFLVASAGAVVPVALLVLAGALLLRRIRGGRIPVTVPRK